MVPLQDVCPFIANLVVRTTINGEGLQHEDGHSHLMAGMVPNCIAYDPTFAYEVAVIVQDGLRRMVEEQEDVFYYITVMNENYAHPALPDGAEEGILKGMYRLRPAANGKAKAPPCANPGKPARSSEAMRCFRTPRTPACRTARRHCRSNVGRRWPKQSST
mgnify:CR=1 FL=1